MLKLYSVIYFDICVYLWNYHHNQIVNKHIPQPQKFPHAPFNTSLLPLPATPPIPQPWWFFTIDKYLLEFHVCGVIQYSFVCLLFLNIFTSIFIPVVVPSYCQVTFYHNLFIHSPVRHLGCLEFLAITNKAAMHIFV